MRKILFSLVLAFTMLSASAQDLSTSVDRQLIVAPVKGQEALFQSFIEFNNLKIVKEYDQLGWYLVEVPEISLAIEIQNSLKKQDYIKDVYRDEVMDYSRDYIPNDTEFNQCWHLSQSTDKDIDAPEAWDILPQDNPWVSVAMFDGGLDLLHPDLAGNIDSPYNAVNGSSSIPYVNAYDNHGTACSGTIAAVTNNNLGVSSVGNNRVKVMPVNIMSAVYSGGSFSTTASIQIAAVNAAIANPNCVAIAMSYGGSNYSAALDAAFQLARTAGHGGKGMMVFASSGNGYSGTAAQYPANYSAVWGVGATTNQDLKASFSNYGQICDISAPGASIRTTDRIGIDGYNTSNYTSISGTSFSCPITAAAAAVIAYKNWELTDDEILQILSMSCDKIGTSITGGYIYSNNPAWPYSTRCNELGYGRINLFNAITITPNPGGTPPPPPSPKHNFTINELTVNPIIVNIADSVSITYNAVTSQPTLDTVTTFVQARYSANSTWGDADDIVIGNDTVVLGGGISTVPLSKTYTVTGLAGTRYILVKANYDGTYIEDMPTDNISTKAFTVNDPSFIGTDAGVELVMPSTNPFSTSSQIINVKWKVTNLGTTPITQIVYYRKWLICNAPIYVPCVSNVTWSGNLLPGQSTFLPGPNSYISLNLCNNSNNCAVPVGTTNTYQLGIVSVNGFSGDGNTFNNKVDLTITRTATNETVYNEVMEIPTYDFYTVTGVKVNISEFEDLPSGLYIVKETYKDKFVTYKIYK